MAKDDAGRALTQEELNEYLSYHNQQLTLPDKYATVTVDGTNVRGLVYRFANEEELKASEEEAAAALKASEEATRLNQQARDAAIKQQADTANRVIVPQMPGSSGPAPAKQTG